MEEVQTSTNGATAPMTQVTDVLRDAIATRAARRDQLAEELAQVKHELANYEKALTLIDGTPRVKSAKPKPAGTSTTKIGPGRLAEVKRAVLDYAQANGGDVEFRQIDIREQMGNTITSGLSSLAFAQLREGNVIRVARKDGNNQYYRLTRHALAEA